MKTFIASGKKAAKAASAQAAPGSLLFAIAASLLARAATGGWAARHRK